MLILYGIASVLSIFIPLLLINFVWHRKALPKTRLAALLGLGGLGWLLAKLPKAAVVLPTFAAYGLPFKMESAQFETALREHFVLLLVAALAAGVFEELCKPAGLLLFRKWINDHDAALLGWALGIGAGALEALLILLGQAGALAGTDSLWAVLEPPSERFFIIFFHGSMTAFLVSFIWRRRFFLGLGVSITVHSMADLVFPYLTVNKILGPVAIQLALYIFVAVFSIIVLKNIRRREEIKPCERR